MQKWEYRILSFHSDRTAGGYSLDGKVFEHTYGSSTKEEYPVLAFKAQMLNKMGAEGWQLISTNDFDFIFRRPIP